MSRLLPFLYVLISLTSFGQGKYTAIYYEEYTNSLMTTPATYPSAKMVILQKDGDSYVGTRAVFERRPASGMNLTIIKSPTVYQNGSLLKDLNFIWTVDSTTAKSYEFTDERQSKKILGYTAQKYKTIVNSNTIEVWVTTEVKGNIGPSLVGISKGVVLEVNINNTYVTTAGKIETLKQLPKAFKIPNPTHFHSRLDFKDLQWRNLFTEIPLVDSAYLGFNPNKKEYNDSYIHAGNGTILIKEITFPELTNELIFLDLKQWSTGDAYDRTGTVFLLTEEQKDGYLAGILNDFKSLPTYPEGSGKYHGTVKNKNYLPPYELMRFFTTFGAGKYSGGVMKNRNWTNDTYYRQDITEYKALLSGKKVYIGFNIGTWTENGHQFSANITLHPGGEEQSQNIIPLFNTVPIMEMHGQEYPHHFLDTNGIVVSFDLKEDAKNVRLRFTTTGHGGHSGGDEFVQITNTVLLDEKVVFTIAPWKSDCATYRHQNPASGNFENGLSSSDYNRSNWCPGQITNPYWIPLGDMKAGTHTIRVKIPQTKNIGGQNNAWYISGQLFY